jgi:hypothetical protein
VSPLKSPPEYQEFGGLPDLSKFESAGKVPQSMPVRISFHEESAIGVNPVVPEVASMPFISHPVPIFPGEVWPNGIVNNWDCWKFEKLASVTPKNIESGAEIEGVTMPDPLSMVDGEFLERLLWYCDCRSSVCEGGVNEVCDDESLYEGLLVL